MTSMPMALSPDGSRIVFTAADAADAVQLYLRTLTDEAIRPIPGTEGGFAPFFSPDGKWIGFAAAEALKKVPIDGGPAVTIADRVLERTFGGATWGGDDTIVFSPGRAAGLSQVAASGGIPRVLTTPVAEHGEVSHFLPQFLPGDRAVLFTMRAGLGDAASRVEVLSIETGLRQLLAPSATNVQYAAPGHVVYAGNGLLAGSLWAAPFDMKTLTVTGHSVRVQDSIHTLGGIGFFALGRTGTLAYLPRGGRAPQELVWVGPGQQPETVAAPEGNLLFPRLSPDGTRLAISLRQGYGPGTGIWLFDMKNPTAAPVLFSNQSSNDHLAVWAPQGARIVFSSPRDGDNRSAPAANLYWKGIDDSGEAERLTTSPSHQDPASWSKDGTWLFFSEQKDIWVLDMRDRARRPIVQTPATEIHPMVSPDGRWLAYTSDESGTNEVYVQAFPGGGEKQRVSKAGGSEPLWSRDGQQLFYRQAKDVVAVAVRTGSTLTVGASTVVVAGGDYKHGGGTGAPSYEASMDGRRFLMVRLNEAATTAGTHLDVILNWFTDVAARQRLR
jgi:serine/threonine-protein kinase